MKFALPAWSFFPCASRLATLYARKLPALAVPKRSLLHQAITGEL